jgi:hypothetical protein
MSERLLKKLINKYMKKYLTMGTLALALFAIAGAGSASASEWFGRNKLDFDAETMAERQEEMFEQQAERLGTSVEDIKEYWAEGMTMREIMEDLGIDEEEFREERMEDQKERQEELLDALVEEGVITEEQAEQRLESLEERDANRGADDNSRPEGKGGMDGRGGRGGMGGRNL